MAPVAGQSVVGYHTTPQIMEIAVWNTYTLVHEIGHALGKAHEHQRPTREIISQYISITRLPAKAEISIQ